MRYVGLLSLLVCPVTVSALDLEPMPPDQIAGIGAALTELASKVEKLPAKIDGDVENARGLLATDQQSGLLLVPAKDIPNDRENPALSEEKGAPVGVLFLHNLLPGELDKKDKLFTVTFTDENGVEREIRFAILTIRKYSDDDFKLQLWGTEDNPLVESPLEEEAGGDKTPVELDLVGEELEITWLGSYPCYLGLSKSTY